MQKKKKNEGYRKDYTMEGKIETEGMKSLKELTIYMRNVVRWIIQQESIKYEDFLKQEKKRCEDGINRELERSKGRTNQELI